MGQEVDLAGLLQQVADGDRRAFGELYRVTSPRLFAIAIRMLRSSDLAEDVLQEAYLLIWRKADRYRPERGAATAWLAAIVRNCAIDLLRARAKAPLVDADAEAEPDPIEVVDADRLWLAIRSNDRLRLCLATLPEEQRRCILLAYYYGKSHEEIAVAVGSPLGTVKSWVRRGLLKLKDCLDG